VERIARLVVILFVVGGVVFGGIALAGNDGGGFKPGKGCGDKNHVHYRQDECKKGPLDKGPRDKGQLDKGFRDKGPLDKGPLDQLTASH
jgi:hypothetical protein